MSQYPDRWHPCYFIEHELQKLGAKAEVIRNAETLNCWGLRINGKLLVWLIDNRHPHEREHEDPAAVELMQRGVVVACAQKPDADRIGSKWLPLAASPGYRPPPEPPKKIYDVAFAGYVRDEARYHALTTIARRYRLLTMQGIFNDNAIVGYWSAWCGVNVPTGWPSETSFDSANMRLFEVLATGVPLVTSHEPYLIDLGLADSINCLTYRTLEELMRCIALTCQVDDGENAQRIGAAGAKLVQDKHTYRHRAEQVLEWLKI